MKNKLPAQKLRGGFYTPEPIVKFITDWTVRSADKEVLEPGCGDGVFLKYVSKKLIELGAKKDSIQNQVRGVEIYPKEAKKARRRLENLGINGSDEIVKIGDFFEFCQSHLKDQNFFDAVVGNPPFIRYQDFLEDQRKIAMELMYKAGFHPNRLTNIWVPFLVGSTRLLRENGRLGMVIPAELLQVDYAAELREFLSTFYRSIVLITFDQLVFNEIQEEVVLFLGDKSKAKNRGIRVAELGNMEDLKTYNHDKILRQEIKPVDYTQDKWTQYFLNKDEILLIKELRKKEIARGRDILDADVGVVTGQNDFFILTANQAQDLGIYDYTVPIVTRSAHLDGVVFRQEDLKSNLQKDLPALLLKIPPKSKELPEAVQSYITSGKEQGIHGGYKCRNRNPWYTVPSTWVPPGFILRQFHEYPKIVVNRTNATSTDTIHRIRPIGGLDIDTMAKALLNSLTFAFSEVIGRSYGGGVLELYPNEIDALPIPTKGADELDVDYLDQVLRKRGIEAVLEITDVVLLRKHLDLSEGQIRSLRAIWQKLRDRRIYRK